VEALRETVASLNKQLAKSENQVLHLALQVGSEAGSITLDADDDTVDVGPVYVLLPADTTTVEGFSRDNLTASFTLPQYLPKGTWSVRSVQCSDNHRGFTKIEAADFYKFGLVDSLEARIQLHQQGAGDFEPPAILDARFEAASFPFNETVTVYILVTATDDVSGIETCTAQAGFFSSSGSLDPPTLAGTMRVPIVFFKGAFGSREEVELRSVTCYDRAGRSTTRDDFPNVTIAIDGVDSESPVFVETAVSTVDGNPLADIQTDDLPLVIKFTTQVDDKGTQRIARCAAQLAPLSGAHAGTIARAPLRLTSGDGASGTWSGLAMLPAGSTPGTYVPTFVCEDYALKSKFDFGGSVNLQGRGNDGAPTLFTSAVLHVVLERLGGRAAPTQLMATLEASDDSPVAFCFTTLRHVELDLLFSAATSPTLTVAPPSLLPDEKEGKNTLELSATLPASLPSGNYYFDRATCADVWGLSNRYEQSFLGLPMFPHATYNGSFAAAAPTLLELTVSPTHVDLSAGAHVNVTITVDVPDDHAPVLGCFVSWVRQEGGETTVAEAQVAHEFETPLRAQRTSAIMRLWVPPTYTTTAWRLDAALCWDSNGAISSSLPSNTEQRIHNTGAVDKRSPTVALADQQLWDVNASNPLHNRFDKDTKQVFAVDVAVTDDAAGVWRCQGRLSLRPPTGAPSELAPVETYAYSPLNAVDAVAPLPRSATVRLEFPLPPPGAPNVATLLYLETIICLDGVGRPATLLGQQTNVTYIPPSPTATEMEEAAYAARLRAFSGDIPQQRGCNVSDLVPPVILGVQPQQDGGTSMQGPTKMTLYVRAVDDASGVDYCTIWLIDDSHDRAFKAEPALLLYPDRRRPAMNEPHTFAITYALPRYMAHVGYSFINITCQDGAGNIAVVETSGFANLLSPRAQAMRYPISSGLRKITATGHDEDRMLGPRLRRAQLLTAAVDTATQSETVRATFFLEPDLRTPRCELHLCAPTSALVGVIPGETHGRNGRIVLKTMEAHRDPDAFWRVSLEGTLPRLAERGFWRACRLQCDYDSNVGPALVLTDVELANAFHQDVQGVYQAGDGDGMPPAITSVQSLRAVGMWESDMDEMALVATMLAFDQGSGLDWCQLFFSLEGNTSCSLATAKARGTFPGNGSSGANASLVTLQLTAVFSQPGSWSFEGIRCTDKAGNAVRGPRAHLVNAPATLQVSASGPPPPPNEDGSGGAGLLIPVIAAVVVIIILVALVVFLLRRRRSQQSKGASKRSSTSVSAFGLPTAKEVREVRSRSISYRHRAASQLSREGVHDLAILRWVSLFKRRREGRVGAQRGKLDSVRLCIKCHVIGSICFCHNISIQGRCPAVAIGPACRHGRDGIPRM
jgi:hypothetical protein